jgi:hypothetical protein
MMSPSTVLEIIKRYSTTLPKVLKSTKNSYGYGVSMLIGAAIPVKLA